MQRSDHRTLGTRPTECGHDVCLHPGDWSPRRGSRCGDVFDTGGLAALMEKTDGLFGRIVALLTRARAIQAAQRVPRLTSGVIEAAAVLDGGETTALDNGGASANSATVHTAAAESDPVPDAALALAPAPPALPDPAGEPLGGAGTVAYWGIPTRPYRHGHAGEDPSIGHCPCAGAATPMPSASCWCWCCPPRGLWPLGGSRRDPFARPQPATEL